jgi:hypothetical protein
MTRKEAISLLMQVNKILVNCNSWHENTHEPLNMAFDMAIKALEQEPVLDKIRAKIIEEKDFAYCDFEQYKVECLGVDAEYVEDELPNDDFRYGMERAMEIIDKYKIEK